MVRAGRRGPAHRRLCRYESRAPPGKRYIDWELPDPKDRPLDEVRALRDEIAQRVRTLVAELPTR